MAVRELPPEVVAQIAAGEVVTRAADVVKELVENAIDAILSRRADEVGYFASDPPPSPSTREGGGESPERETRGIGVVDIEIWDGGYTRIQVSDDGCGIAAEDLPHALQRHATSKIACAEDLQRLASLGFRGEALAAISAVADVTITSSLSPLPPGGAGSAMGASIEVQDGGMGPVHPRARRPGTTVTVERLFERVPARRKYQRASSVETAYIGGMVQAFAFAYSEIAFTLASNGRPVFRSPGTGDLGETASALLGPEAGRELLAIRDDREPEEETTALATLSGLIGTPSLHRASRNGILLAVNRRPVENRSLAFAIEEAYATQLPVGRHPVAIVQVTVPAGEVDANVHPTKREVRLLRERLVFGIVQRAVRGTLVQAIGIPRIGERPWGPTPVPEDPLDAAPVPMFQASPARAQDDDAGRPRLGSLRILGQVALTYIICEGRAGLYLVDQHAAHERVTLERLERDLQRRERSQLLLEPIAVELPQVVRAAAEEYVGALVGLGFAAELLAQDAVVVRAVPTALRARHIERVLHETHEALDEEGAGPDWRERLAVLLSCKTAIKAGQRLEAVEMQSLLDQLDEATLCATCSHGRPTAILLSHSQLEREFGRR